MKLIRTLQAILREIFEESAYERFCARKGVGISRESYELFLQETDQRRQHKFRCC